MKKKLILGFSVFAFVIASFCIPVCFTFAQETGPVVPPPDQGGGVITNCYCFVQLSIDSKLHFNWQTTGTCESRADIVPNSATGFFIDTRNNIQYPIHFADPATC